MRFPRYWTSAIDTIDALSGDAPVLILPGFARNRYRWGFVGDDIFDALLERQHVERQSFTQDAGTDETGDLIASLDERTVDGTYRPGSFAPIARRLGIRWVVVRNDIDWRATGAPRPAQLSAFRSDPDLLEVATFGAPGENVVEAGDVSATILGEDRLPPVELYEVRDALPPVHAVADRAPTLVSGAGQSWMRLARDGTLDSSGPLRYTASVDPEQLRADLDAGSPIIVTDGNRRRVVQVTGERNFESATLPAGAGLNRPALDLFGVAGSQSVATYGDAVAITSSADDILLPDGFRPWLRPANAFDGSLATSWLLPSFTSGVDSWLQVTLRSPAVIPSVTLVTSPVSSRRIVRATIELSDGSRIPVRLDSDGTTSVLLPAVGTTSLRVVVDELGGVGTGPFGFAEISVGDLDLAERIQVPDDLFRSAANDAGLSSLVERADVRYSFERAVSNGDQATELSVRRSFRTVGSRRFRITGSVQVGADVSDAALAALLPASASAVGSSRSGSPLEARSSLAIDGSPATSWAFQPRPGEHLDLAFPDRQVHEVRVLFPLRAAGSIDRSSRVHGLHRARRRHVRGSGGAASDAVRGRTRPGRNVHPGGRRSVPKRRQDTSASRSTASNGAAPPSGSYRHGSPRWSSTGSNGRSMRRCRPVVVPFSRSTEFRSPPESPATPRISWRVGSCSSSHARRSGSVRAGTASTRTRPRRVRWWPSTSAPTISQPEPNRIETGHLLGPSSDR